MRKICEDFILARLPVAGLAACGAYLPDGTTLYQCFGRWLSPDQVRQATARLGHSHETLRRHGLEPLQITWVFEHLLVCLCLRSDKAWLALFLENRSELPLQEIESVLQEFANLPAS
jgi:hypothetical protein